MRQTIVREGKIASSQGSISAPPRGMLSEWPGIVIPMHYYGSRGVLDIEPVGAFLERHPADSVTWVIGSEQELTPESLPAEALHIYVLGQSR
jgi:hypothetical protein